MSPPSAAAHQSHQTIKLLLMLGERDGGVDRDTLLLKLIRALNSTVQCRMQKYITYRPIKPSNADSAASRPVLGFTGSGCTRAPSMIRTLPTVLAFMIRSSCTLLSRPT
ncbi:hypothetical protein ASALC70_04075 [Alcanivorax sp. ALC70]|nr:hypothetical protein ASALC70_04075 [Alcanivorax sp. ALC70]